jgi:hypothetical protein
MKYIVGFILTVLFGACNQPDSKKPENSTGTDTFHSNKTGNIPATDVPNKDEIKKGSAQSKDRDILLMQASEEILKAIKKKLRRTFFFCAPRIGVRFSPYAYIDTTTGKLLSATELIKQGKEQKTILWGIYDGKETVIKMNINNYFNQFVYDADFLHAEKKSVNEFLGSGNSLNNLKEIYPGYDFTEFYFPGFDPKYEGMDWRTLRLVFKMENNKPYLVAIVHDQWTI